ncbi:LPXTG cell wall anchor domain-containing protein [Companilactobacillus jidongensis]|uniref:LPXTG cell wall anchor domain-containing protein n=1 Tax=Companilactobacillus jidongensis TaxID=2486006 RepID=UPI000F7AF6A8|nr:LPXTG cell wall anchor domain-containing protein [Companilactobacillus jidongensis]
MKKRQRTSKSLSLKKRIVGYFAIAVIVLGVVGGFGVNHVIAESTNSSGGVARSEAVVANTDDSLDGGGGSNANVLVNSDNTGENTGSTATKDVDYTPSVNVNNMSSYPQTGDAHEYGYVIMGFSILIGLFAFYMKKIHRFTTD